MRQSAVMVSADHAHTSQIIPDDAGSTLITNEGVPMTTNYATSTPGESQEHTGTQVRVAGMGPPRRGPSRFRAECPSSQDAPGPA
ncbi:hypothetical protein ABT337_18400 [Saccharopolyspora hirsuta]|uniref:hypothetical protein n=1 Tax=Saccharopolyspora hirsuta TaxID=1837 RepID=UPI003317C39D